MRHIVGLSGGKDSTAMALRLRELFPEQKFEYICTPTGDELPEMVEHWNNLECLLGTPLTYLVAKREDGGHETLHSLIEDFEALPNYRMRWCTRILKIEPYENFLESAAPAISYVGLRADEPPDLREGGVYDHIDGVTQTFPMREWGWKLQDVHQYLQSRGVSIPWRTDCALCYHQQLRQWWRLHKEYPEHFKRGVDLERTVSDAREKPHTFRSPKRDKWPASLAELAQEFEAGKMPRGVEVMDDLFGDGGICRVCTL